MRRKQLFILLPVLLVLFGTSRMAAGGTLSVFPGCFNAGGGVAACNSSVTGGTGNYVSYSWKITDAYWGSPTFTYYWVSSDPWMQLSCRVGGAVTFTLTVTDSQGDTGTGIHSIVCSGSAD